MLNSLQFFFVFFFPDLTMPHNWTDEDHEQFCALHAQFNGVYELILPHMVEDITLHALRSKWPRLMAQDAVDPF